MSKLFKGFFALVVVIALGALVGPFIVGFIVKKDVQAYQDQIPSNTGVKLSVQNYQRGWFSSTADMALSIDLNHNKQAVITQAPNQLNFTMKNTIHHGPIVFYKTNSGFHLKFAKAYLESTVSKPNIPLNLEASLEFTGNVLTELNADRVAQTISDNISIVIQGLSAQQTNSNKFTEINTAVKLNALDILDKSEAHLRVKNLSHDSKFTQGSHDFWKGYGVTTVASVLVDTKKNDKFELQGLALNQKSDITTDGRASMGFNANINSIKINSDDFGQQAMALSVNNMDAEILKALTEALDESDQAMMPFGKAYRLLLMFLSKGININVSKFDINTTLGRIQATANVDLPQKQTNIGMPTEVIERVQAEADIKMPRAIAESLMKMLLATQAISPGAAEAAAQHAPAQVQLWVDHGWFVVDGNYLRTKIRIHDSKIYLNDKIFEPVAASTIAKQEIAPKVAAPAATAITSGQ